MSSNGSDLGVISFSIRGTSPMVQHNGRLASPLDPIAKQIKAYTSKRKKTDDDYEQVAMLEVEGGLYTNDEGRVVVPGDVIEGALFEAAKRTKNGSKLRQAVFSPGDWPLDFPGKERSIAEIIADPKHVKSSRVVVNGGTVVRTRPVFRSWALKFEVNYLKSEFDPRTIVEITMTLGSIIGLSDDRHKGGGRFEILSWMDYNEGVLHKMNCD